MTVAVERRARKHPWGQPLALRSTYYRIPTKKQQDVGEYLEALEKKLGRPLQAADVVADARSVRSPLHRFFTWDDSKAAAKHRLHEARMLIRAYSVTFADPLAGQPITTRAFIRYKPKEGNTGYTSVARLSPVELHDLAVREGLLAFERLRERFGSLPEFKFIFKALDEARTIFYGARARKQGRPEDAVGRG